MRVFGPSIGSRLLLLVLVALVPMLLFSAVLLERAYRASADLIEDSTLNTAQRVAAAVDAQVGRAEAVGAVLAEMPARDLYNLPDFEEAATHALSAAGLDGELVLIGPDGTVIADTLRTGAEAARQAEDRATVNLVFSTGKSQVSGLFHGYMTHEYEVAIHVPVMRDGAVRFDAAVLLPAKSIATSLMIQGLPERWFALIVDQSAHVIDASSQAGEETGNVLSPAMSSLLRQGEGVGRATTSRNKHLLLGFTRSELTGWSVAVGVPERVLHRPLLGSIGTLATGGAAILIASMTLAWIIGRNISRPLAALAREAAGLGRNELPDTRQIWGLAEAEATARAMRIAGEQLRTRNLERDTALSRAEASEQRLLLAQEVGEIGTWEIDLKTRERTWSPQQFALYDLSPARGIPKNSDWIAQVHPDDRNLIMRNVERASLAPIAYSHVFRIIRSDGNIRWLRTAARSMFEDGVLARVVGISIDVTDRQEAERNLRESAQRLEAEVSARTAELAQSEARFRSYFDYSSDALVVLRVTENDGFVYETVNPMAERIFGIERAAFIGKTPADLFVPDDAASAVAGLRKVVTTGKPVTLERVVKPPAGTLLLETILVPVQGAPNKGIVRVIGASRDLTERKRIENRLAHAQRLEAVGQLTGGVAHDFNNLLTVMIGNLALLRKRLDDDPRITRYIASIEAAAERGARLTASLLAFSRRQTLQVEPIDIGARIQDSVTLLRRALGEEIEFTLTISPRLALANADTAQLEAAVLNLVINARDALTETNDTRRGGTLSVRIAVGEAVLSAPDLEGNEEAQPGRFVAVEVIDNGAGMPAPVRARAFEPFFTTKEVGRGTGLGLSQVFGFVRQLGGHVVLDSTMGQGTRVVMYLPAAIASPLTASASVPEPCPVPRNRAILVVEDDPGIRETTAEVLHDAGLRVLTAANSTEAIDILRGPDTVELLFSDIAMPGGANGVDLARQARSLRPGMAILLTSGYAGEALSRFGAESEYELLAKPYTRQDLLARIGEMLRAAPDK